MPGRKRSVLVLSDQVLFRQALAAALREEGYQVAEQGTTASLRAKRPDVAVADLSHAMTDTMRLVNDLHEQLPDVHLVLMGSPTRLAAAIEHDRDAQLEFPRADLAALVRVIEGRATSATGELVRAQERWTSVTPRQRDVMRLLAHGLDNTGIASKLKVGTRAIKAHISALLALFDLESRTQLALLASAGGLMPPK